MEHLPGQPKDWLHDLSGVLESPALWTSLEPTQIAGTLLDLLLGVLRLDFGYVQLAGTPTHAQLEVIRLARHVPGDAERVRRVLAERTSREHTSGVTVIPNPTGDGEVSIASQRLDWMEGVGMLVVGARRADFPTRDEQSLLQAVGQRSLPGRRGSQGSVKQWRVTEELRRRVAERTERLADNQEMTARTLSALRESEARNRAFCDHSPNMIFQKDVEGRYLYVNEEFERGLGVHGSIIGKTDEEVFSPEQAAVFRANDLRVLDAGVAMEFEEVTRQEDGPHTSIVHKFPLRNADGRIYAIGGIVTDITSRKRALEEVERLRKQLELDNAYLHEQMKEGLAFGEIIGESPALHTVLGQIEMVASTDAAVLITGESGTGKELVARAIHDRSKRRHRPMVTVNCASVPHSLFESEFFGHVRGSFTGALRDRTGRFQLADKGTIFLDEVAEIPLEQQGKLLRVLQNGHVQRVGEDRITLVDVRVIAATNRDLRRELDAGRFRYDLYYRLCVFPMHLPPLRERREDIRHLAAHFVELARRRLNRPQVRLTEHCLERLEQYDWPGNVRELLNVIERAVILTPRGPLRLGLVLGEAAPPLTTFPKVHGATHQLPDAVWADLPMVLPQAELRRRERDNIMAALRTVGWKLYGHGGAAELLGMKPTTLASRLKRLGINRQSSAVIPPSPSPSPQQDHA